MMIQATVGLKGNALDSPVPSVLLHQFVLKEEPTVVSTHIAVTQTTAIDNLLLLHLIPGRSSLCFVDPVWLEPVVMWNKAKLHGCPSEYRDTPGSSSAKLSSVGLKQENNALFELWRKWFLIQEDIGIVMLPIKPLLHFSDTPQDPIQIAIPCQNNKGRIGLSDLQLFWKPCSGI